MLDICGSEEGYFHHLVWVDLRCADTVNDSGSERHEYRHGHRHMAAEGCSRLASLGAEPSVRETGIQAAHPARVSMLR
jgi:hypothetical protein